MLKRNYIWHSGLGVGKLQLNYLIDQRLFCFDKANKKFCTIIEGYKSVKNSKKVTTDKHLIDQTV